MGFKICSFASGSRGNCSYVASDTTAILVDAGISAKRVCESIRALGERGKPISLLITHTHADHVGCIKSVVKALSPTVYVHVRSYRKVRELLPSYDKLMQFDGDFFVGDVTVSPFSVSHDVPCVGYSFYHEGKKITVATDVGKLTAENVNHIQGSDVALIESNHDVELLKQNTSYTYELKRRIMSEYGHLSNSACAQIAVKLALSGTKHFLLGHLSQENNTPAIAYKTTFDELTRQGLSAGVCVATQEKMSELLEIS